MNLKQAITDATAAYTAFNRAVDELNTAVATLEHDAGVSKAITEAEEAASDMGTAIAKIKDVIGDLGV